MCTLRHIWVISIEIAPSTNMCSASVQNILSMESSIIDSKHMAKWSQLSDGKTEFQILNEIYGGSYLKKGGETRRVHWPFCRTQLKDKILKIKEYFSQ